MAFTLGCMLKIANLHTSLQLVDLLFSTFQSSFYNVEQIVNIFSLSFSLHILYSFLQWKKVVKNFLQCSQIHENENSLTWSQMSTMCLCLCWFILWPEKQFSTNSTSDGFAISCELFLKHLELHIFPCAVAAAIPLRWQF